MLQELTRHSRNRHPEIYIGIIPMNSTDILSKILQDSIVETSQKLLQELQRHFPWNFTWISLKDYS